MTLSTTQGDSGVRARLNHRLVLVFLACIVSAACAPERLSTQTADVGPPFAIPDAFLIVRPGATLKVFASSAGPTQIAQLGEGDLLQVVDRSDTGRFSIQFPDSSEGSLFGWADLGQAANSQVEPARLAGCPRDLKIEHLAGLSDPERLLCYGNRELAFAAVQFLVLGVADASFRGDPAWLAQVTQDAIESAKDGPMLSVHLPPEIQRPGQGNWVSVQGHFDDPRSAKCQRVRERADGADESGKDAIRWCRQQFVITNLKPAPAPRPETAAPDIDAP